MHETAVTIYNYRTLYGSRVWDLGFMFIEYFVYNGCLYVVMAEGGPFIMGSGIYPFVKPARVLVRNVSRNGWTPVTRNP